MPPKGAQKKTADKAVATPTKTKAKAKPKVTEETSSEAEAEEESPKPIKTPVKKSPKKTSTTVEFAPLKPNQDLKVTVPIDVHVSNQEPVAEPKKRGSGFDKMLKLESADKFEVLRTFMVADGPDEGCQVLLLRPAKPFRFLELSDQLKGSIFKFYFANRGVVNDPIQLDGKRRGLVNDVYAKTYANDSKNRVALLAVNKAINEAATPIFYSIPIRLEGTASIMDFMAQIEAPVRQHLTSVIIKNYQKASARTALSLLAECRNLKRVHFDSGVFSEGDPEKAAKVIYGDARKFLQAIGMAKGDKTAGVDVLSFGKNALSLKDESKGGDGKTSNWPEHMVEELKDSLRAKLT